MSKNLSKLSGRKAKKDEHLFEKLGELSEKNGTVSSIKTNELSDAFLFGKANIHGTVSFYDFLKPDNKNKKVYICNGSACMTAGTQDKLRKKIKKYFNNSEIGEMTCLGRCHENSAFHIHGKNFSGQDHKNLEAINKRKYHSSEQYNSGFLGKPVIMAPFGTTPEFYKKFSISQSGQWLDELKESGLRGRGGAGFPAAVKLESCKNAPGNEKYIVCNADEGDPGAYSDRYIMENHPHLLLMGMYIAGFICGAEKGIIYVRAEYPESVAILEKSIKESKKYFQQIGGEICNFKFKIIKAKGAYICGEETALLSSIEGQRPEVRVRPPFPAYQGLYNMPTVVNNVETLACIPWIIIHGGKEFAKIGKGKSTGTKLVSLDGFFNNPGVYEVEMGTPLKDIFKKLGGGLRKNIKAYHIGGPLGGLVPQSQINKLSLDFESFSENGFLLGHASVVSLPDTFPIIDYIKHLFQFTAHESCGKCFPCRLGSMRGYELIQKSIEDSSYKIDSVLFGDLLETMQIGSLCALGGGLPLPVKNALQYFEKELKPYFTH